MGAGKTSKGRVVAERLGRRFVDLDDEIARRTGSTIPELFAVGEPHFRSVEEDVACEVLARAEPVVLALGGGAVGSPRTREALRARALTVLLDVSADDAWQRARGADRPLARREEQFRALYEERRPLYAQVADAHAGDADGIVLAAAGVRVEAGALARLAELVPGGEPVALVSDAHVGGIHGPAAQVALGARLASAHELPVGEEAKSLAAYERLLGELALERAGTLAALGGGCTTDAAGFAAATYLRGVAWVPVPTTLVGQVDAAIGGKTALNLARGKNLVGAFHWPARVVVDPETLATLPARHRREGLAEVVKTGLLAGDRVWELPDAELVRRCAAYKAALCLRDPTEQGPRAVLNLGHTFAHALEAAAAYDTVSHGEAVALGLTAALRLSGHEALRAEVERLLEPRPVRVDRERAWAALRLDKKTRGGRPRLVLLDEPGRPRYGVELPDEDVRRALDELIAG